VDGQDDDVTYAAAQATRLARIRARIREGVWALRDNSVLHGHWDAMERGMPVDDDGLKPDKTSAAVQSRRRL